MELTENDSGIKHFMAAAILLNNGLLTLALAEHGGSLSGLLYDSRLLLANGVSPDVAMEMQTAWSTAAEWTPLSPRSRVMCSALLVCGVYTDAVVLNLPWLLTSFLESCSQLIVLLSCCWIILFNLEQLTVSLITFVILQLLLIYVHSGVLTTVALWTFQSTVEAMLEAAVAAHGTFLFMDFQVDPEEHGRTQAPAGALTAREEGERRGNGGRARNPPLRRSGPLPLGRHWGGVDDLRAASLPANALPPEGDLGQEEDESDEDDYVDEDDYMDDDRWGVLYDLALRGLAPPPPSPPLTRPRLQPSRPEPPSSPPRAPPHLRRSPTVYPLGLGESEYSLTDRAPLGYPSPGHVAEQDFPPLFVDASGLLREMQAPVTGQDAEEGPVPPSEQVPRQALEQQPSEDRGRPPSE